MKEEYCIEVSNISKSFSKNNSENDLMNFAKSLLLFKRKKSERRLILKNISFKVKPGEFVGVIGRNGTGKSTLLKLIMGTLKPDSGEIITKGKIIRMALAMGFDEELNAKENIYLNGTVLGLTFKHIGTVFNKIIEFAELEDFIYTPLKFYSSGMRSRLAFSVAVHADADIFLMDEFFGGVGDEIFRQKSEEIFKKSLVDGRTIIHVSHNVNMLLDHADKVLFLEDGEVKAYGKPDEVIPFYKEYFKQQNQINN
jgi:ABC-type polysaccharide/polyol phosphate transport system ATPase subunit